MINLNIFHNFCDFCIAWNEQHGIGCNCCEQILFYHRRLTEHPNFKSTFHLQTSFIIPQAIWTCKINILQSQSWEDILKIHHPLRNDVHKKRSIDFPHRVTRYCQMFRLTFHKSHKFELIPYSSHNRSGQPTKKLGCRSTTETYFWRSH